MIKNLLSDDEPEPEPVSKRSASGDGVLNLLDLSNDDPQPSEPDTQYVQTEPESVAETVRRTGLAWSAGVAFLGAVVFMMILGWGADLLLASSPWGVVIGIVIGSAIGFIQFFRITSQIFKK